MLWSASPQENERGQKKNAVQPSHEQVAGKSFDIHTYLVNCPPSETMRKLNLAPQGRN